MNEYKSLTDIANASLATIGSNFIQSFEEDTDDKACILRQFMKIAICEVQGLTDWQELEKEDELVLAQSECTEFGYAFNLPKHIIRPIAWADKEWNKMPHFWNSPKCFKVKGGLIYLGTKSAILRYSKYSFNPSEWSSELANAVIKMLSAKIATPITKSPQATAELENLFYARNVPRILLSAKKRSEGTIVSKRGKSWAKINFRF